MRGEIRSSDKSERMSVSKKLQQIVALACGVIVIGVPLVLAMAIPYPGPFQHSVFRAAFALAAAGLAASLPGFLPVTISAWIRAGAALGVFVVAFFYNPIAPVAAIPSPTTPFPIVLACRLPAQVVVDTTTLLYSDIQKNDTYDSFRSMVAKLPNQHCDQSKSKIFRIKDAALLVRNGTLNPTSGGNVGVIVVPADVVADFGGDHMAFSKLQSVLAAK